MTNMIEMNGIDHYAIHVRDLQRSADWYEQILGFRILHKWNTTWMVGRGNIKVGLFLRPDAQPIGDPEVLIHISHVAFAVDGDKFDAAHQALVAAGVQVEGPDDSGIAYGLFFKDPDGHELELTTYYKAQAPTE